MAAWGFHVGIVALMAIAFTYPLSGIAFASLFALEGGLGPGRRRRPDPHDPHQGWWPSTGTFSGVQTSPTPTLRFRPTGTQTLVSGGIPGLVFLLGAVLTDGTTASLLVGAAAGSLVVALARRRVGLDVTAHGFMIRQLTATTALAWTDIVSVAVVRVRRRRCLAVTTRTGLHHPWAPFHSTLCPNPAFDRAAADISAALAQQQP